LLDLLVLLVEGLELVQGLLRVLALHVVFHVIDELEDDERGGEVDVSERRFGAVDRASTGRGE